MIAFFDFLDALPLRWKVYLTLGAMVLVPLLWIVQAFWFVKDVVEDAKKPWYGDDEKK